MVISILALLFSVGLGVIGARAATQKRVFETYTELCLTSAEKRRNYLSNQAFLPTSCAALGAPPPPGITTASITDSGAFYTVTITGAHYSRTEQIAKQITR